MEPPTEIPQISPSMSTPMLMQYQAIKKDHQDCILFFRLGDFYEMFFEDAQAVSGILDLTLTARGKGTPNAVPMCGFPHHAAEGYIAKLIKAGYKIAICEQMEDPTLAKGIVKRDVTRIITSGTYLDENSSDIRYLMSVNISAKVMGISFVDPSVGTIQTNEYALDAQKLVEIIARLPVFECIYPEAQDEWIKKIFQAPMIKTKNIVLSPFSDWCFNAELSYKALCDHYGTLNLHGFGLEDKKISYASAGALLEYLKQMNKQPLKHLDRIALYADNDYTYISPAAHRGLEIDDLIKTLDATQTVLGRRNFRYWIYHPLKNAAAILHRQDAVTLLKDDAAVKTQLKDMLSRIPDVEKNISRLSCGYTQARDLLSIRNTLALIPELKDLIAPLVKRNKLFELNDVADLRKTLMDAINEDIPLSNSEGKVIRQGYHKELDELKLLQQNGRQWLQELQAKEVKRTGINSLKIGFNKVFGYYIEITNTNLSLAPKEYIRKQTLANCERFITQELKEFEEKILTAQDKIVKIENEMIQQLKDLILSRSLELHELCQNIATIDTIFGLSILAQNTGYIAPKVDNSTTIDIKDGRHPVVERSLGKSFIANDTLLDREDNQLIILTGPNMAGKSTYIRQTAILVILAQTGSYIPARSAVIGIVDKVFTRIGAHDDITRGQSTFMVEMNETADILNNITDRSLVILDEIGRGTSTFDGLSLAWALAEHFHRSKARTLFATHFHELTALAEEHKGIKNYNVAVKEWKDEIVFLHKIVPGSTDDSYGIYVAKLAGIPNDVIKRARHILSELETKNNIKQNLSGKHQEEQLNLFAKHNDPVWEDIKETIQALDVNKLTPLEALNELSKLKERIKSSLPLAGRVREGG